MLSSHRVRCCSIASLVSVVSLGLAVVASCGPSTPAPDAAPISTIPTSPAGRFTVTSTFDIAVPTAAGPVISGLTAATDGPDDPTRYLLDRMIATLPDGAVKTIATQAAPFVAAYLNGRLGDVAPGFVAGIDTMAGGLSRIAGRFSTVETLVIDRDGAAIRTITGARFELAATPVTVGFAQAGLADITVGTHVALDAAGHLVIGDHAYGVPYGAVLRLGLDHAVIPGVEPTARDLATALGLLVDCAQLGMLVADRIGLGSPALYGTACRAAMTAAASELYARLAAIDQTPLALEVTGAADGVDLDGDGTMDELRTGTWSGSLHDGSAREPIAAARFTGYKAP
jgi:hypothetical protein